MKPPLSAAPPLYLKPGELYIGEKPTVVSTVLGSCVSVTLYSWRLRVGAICHALLPTGPLSLGFRFVDSSVAYMLDRFREMGIGPQGLEAKIFGGGDILPTDGKTATVGRQNIEAALRAAAAAEMAVAASDVGGVEGRKIVFHTETGEVYVRKVRNLHEILAGEERKI